MTTNPQFGYTGPTPDKGFVGFVNIQATDDGVRFTVRSEGEDPLMAAFVVPVDIAVELLGKALASFTEAHPLSDAQIKHMVDRFLGWKLPANFRPDAGISFKAEFNENTPHPMKHEPVGTNLLDATQADEMVRHIAAGLPKA